MLQFECIKLCESEILPPLEQPQHFTRWSRPYRFLYTGYTQKNVAVSKVNKKFISHLTRTQVSKFLMLTAGPRGQFPRWRRSRKRLSVFSVLRCPDLWLQCSVSFVHGLEKTHHAWCVFSKHTNRIKLYLLELQVHGTSITNHLA